MSRRKSSSSCSGQVPASALESDMLPNISPRDANEDATKLRTFSRSSWVLSSAASSGRSSRSVSATIPLRASWESHGMVSAASGPDRLTRAVS